MLMELSYSTIIRHLTEIRRVKEVDEWVPHRLSNVQKLRRMETDTALAQRDKSRELEHGIFFTFTPVLISFIFKYVDTYMHIRYICKYIVL